MKAASPLFDVVTAIFLLLTVAVIAVTLLLIANPRSPLNPLPQPTPVSIIVQATDLPTSTPTSTPTPGPATATPTATGTATASFTPLPSSTPTASFTPVIALRGTTVVPKAASVGPTAPLYTLAPFEYTASTIKYQANATADGCKWSSIAGKVLGLNGAPQKGIAVSVVGGSGTIDETHYSGQEPRFGEGGFEVFLGTQPREDDYTVTLLSKTGAQISDPVKLRTHSSCKENVTLINFYQNH